MQPTRNGLLCCHYCENFLNCGIQCFGIPQSKCQFKCQFKCQHQPKPCCNRKWWCVSSGARAKSGHWWCV